MVQVESVRGYNTFMQVLYLLLNGLLISCFYYCMIYFVFRYIYNFLIHTINLFMFSLKKFLRIHGFLWQILLIIICVSFSSMASWIHPFMDSQVVILLFIPFILLLQWIWLITHRKAYLALIWIAPYPLFIYTYNNVIILSSLALCTHL